MITLTDEKATPDRLQLEWGIAAELACRLIRMAHVFQERTTRELIIISGYRSCERQQELAAQGRPAAPCNVSNHTVCPARAVDLYIQGASMAPRQLKLDFGDAALIAGLRWGGGSPLEDGIPSDWNHVDLGPRNA